MRNTIAIMQRELLSLFYSPIGYIVIAGFLLITGILMWMSESFEPGKPATLRAVFFWTPCVLTVIIPAVTMRSVAEEYRTGTIETLMTAPVTDFQLILGKYLASLFFVVVMLAATLIYVILMAAFGNPDLGMTFASYLGLLLLATAFTAIGTFTSAITRNQIVAWIVGAIPLLLFAFLAYFFAPRTDGWVRAVLQQINVVSRLDAFNRGDVTLESVVFFLGSAVLFLFLSVKVVESRRWR
ncbi:MAG: ABC transporter permease [Phycisphaerae bacterium]